MTAVLAPRVELLDSPARMRDFHRLWIGETTSAVGSSVTAVALPLVALTVLHAGVLAVSVLTASAWLPWLVLGLPAGAWADRLPPRGLMIWCDAVSLAAFASVPVAAWCGLLTIGQLVVVAFVAGTAKVFFSTAYRIYLPGLLPDDRLADANAKLQGGEAAANVAGPGLGGLLAQALGAVNALLADALSFVVSLICLRRMEVPERRRPVAARQSLRSEIAVGVRFVLGDPLLRVFTVFGGAANFLLTAFAVLEIPFLVRDLGLAPGTAGVVLAAIGCGGVIGALVAPVAGRRFGTARTLLVAKVGLAPAALLVPLAGSGAGLAWFVVGGFVVVAGVVAGNVTSAGFVPRYCPPDRLGRVTTAMQVVNFGAIPLGALAGGALAGAVGIRPALWVVLAGFVASCAILMCAPLHGARDLPTRTFESS